MIQRIYVGILQVAVLNIMSSNANTILKILFVGLQEVLLGFLPWEFLF
jgi:hypothetical protein